MTVLQDTLIDGVVNYIDTRIVKGRVKINGEMSEVEVERTILDGRTIRKYILIDNQVGFIEEAQLLSESGEILASKPYSINKSEEGIALVFEITVSLQEG